MEIDKLKELAQQKLADARKLIDEAGELAKEGQFYLHFGEIGEFIPSSLDDDDKLREKALNILKEEGMSSGGNWVRDLNGTMQWVDNPPIPYEMLSDQEIEDEIDCLVANLRDELGVSYEAQQYGERDQWWHPSRC